MKLDVASVIQMVKVQDLQKFANSIIEIMVGMCEENREVRDESQQEVNKAIKTNLITGGIQMDLIPLNWSKLAESRNIIKILSMLFGPYNTAGNIDIDTSKIFYDVNQIAENTYLINHCQHAEQGHTRKLHQQSPSQIDSSLHQRRLDSVNLNNQAVTKFLNIAPWTSTTYDIRKSEQ